MAAPKLLRKFANYLSRRRLYSQNKDILSRNRKLKDLRKGRRCFIIGNGPSIKNQDLTKLKNEETFVVNTFWRHPQYLEINPKYYVLVDAEAFPNEKERGKVLHNEFIERSRLLEKLPTKFFFHINGKEFIEKNDILPNGEIFYLSFLGHFRENLKFDIDIDEILPYSKNVIVCAIEIAAYMGFEEIYLLGCEHSGLASPAHRHYEGFKHFFENPKFDTKSKEDIKHYALDIMPYEAHLHHYKILFQNYRLLKQKLAKEKPQVRIYNATPNSFLDVFQMVKFEDIV